jgi:integrase
MGRNGGDRLARTLNRLTPIAVSRSRRKGLHADGGGLYLRISESGTKGWIFRYGKNGKYHDLGLGATHTISLPRARELARECRELLWVGTDPIAHRRASLAEQKASDAKVMPFKQCAEAYIASHEAGWRNALHRQQWTNTLAQHVYPVLGELPVASIDTAHVLKVIEPMWRTIPETASRVRGRIERVLDFAKVRGFRNGENPARWRGHLDHLLPAKRKVKRIDHRAAMPYAEIGAFMAELRKAPSPAACALEFTILTAARTGEVLGGTWGEIDLAAKVWIVPASRIKAGREHRVPLSSAAMRALGTSRSPKDPLFPINPGGRHMSRVLAKTRPGLTLHGFRSTFRDWASECTSFPHEVCEMALAHAIPSAVEAAYRRGDLFEKRRKLMEVWADFCAKPAASGKMVAVNRGRRER